MDYLALVRAVAVTYVWTRGAIFSRVRNNGPALWRELANCPLCSGFWVGVAYHVNHANFTMGIFEIVGDGAIVATLALAVTGVIRRL